MPPEQNVAPTTTAEGSEPSEATVWHWYHKFSAVLLILLCLEVGLFLLVFPWSEYWQNNYFSGSTPEWRRFWVNPYVRGVVSGLGVVNLFFSLAEILGLRRFARKPQ
jgi:hypothetical protein